MTKGICISAFSSGSGKTLITLSILRELANLKQEIQPFKAGPDFIDPIFHKNASYRPSINLDLFMMKPNELKAIFNHYTEDRLPIVEGAMGFYDGIEKGYSSYDLALLLDIPVILVISACGVYSSIAALIKGMLTYRENNTIEGIILNHISNKSHFSRIKDIIEKDFPKMNILGWVQKDCVEIIKSKHLGLDINYSSNTNFDEIAKRVCSNIDLKYIINITQKRAKTTKSSLFSYIDDKTRNNLKQKKISIVYDEAFSFLYHDNRIYLGELFRETYIISATKNNIIPSDTDLVYIPGGYVETKEAYSLLQNSNDFKMSLINIAKKGRIYAECAGLIYLGNSIIDNENNILKMSNILPISFKMRKTRKRLGYYLASSINNEATYKGHSFHYSEVDRTKQNSAIPLMKLFKEHNEQNKEIAAWANEKNNVIGTYLHTFLRTSPQIIQNYFV